VNLHDGERVEAVIMRHGTRATLCVSSQVGCAMGCTFCATGTMGLRGNLSSGKFVVMGGGVNLFFIVLMNELIFNQAG